MKKIKNGFTLSEVLIALTIIGVIAAITVPALMQNTQKQEYVSALQKAYSTLSQAANMIIAEEGSPVNWMTDVDNLYTLFKSHILNAKECGSGTGCFQQIGYKSLNGGKTDWGIENSKNVRKLVLSDGAQLMFHSWMYKNCNGITGEGSIDTCGIIRVDINGAKGPNTAGRDYFQFVIKENGLYPAGCDDESECTDNKDGLACTCKVLREGAINY